MVRRLSLIVLLLAMLVSSSGVSAETEYIMDAKKGLHLLPDRYSYDLRPGLMIACRVKFDSLPDSEHSGITILQKGMYSQCGSYCLRLDPRTENGGISFFVNTGNGPEPRVTASGVVKPGMWYDVKAGWDGSNAWITVDGKTSKVPRLASVQDLECAGDLQIGKMVGRVRGLSVTGPERKVGTGRSISAGMRVSCKVKFSSPPSKGITTIVQKPGEYWLRYQKGGGSGGRFEYYVHLDGKWGTCAALPFVIETNREYVVGAEWTGSELSVSVDDAVSRKTKRSGCVNRTSNPFVSGDGKVLTVTDLCIRNTPRPIAELKDLLTVELMPRIGVPSILTGKLCNLAIPLENAELTVVADGGMVSPSRIALKTMREMEVLPLSWKVDGGTNGVVNLMLRVWSGGRKVTETRKRIVFMPQKDPVQLSRSWNPPVLPVKAYYVDSVAGDDSADGLSPATAWRTFKNVSRLVLGPGCRLLLKRGCVFAEELRVNVRGSAENWSEIGAYGEGMRPQIRRTRHIDERCAVLQDPAYVAVRDLVFCDAGVGFMAVCQGKGTGNILVERCLAHHIEGLYRFNAHGIPEWRDCRGPSDPPAGFSVGLHVGGVNARNVVMRDCEMYQCSSGFSVSGMNTFVTRVFCHDNYVHNTSPHPFNRGCASWMTDCVFDASGWHASAGTMGIMLASNEGFIIRGCHFLNQPDSGSPDQGGVDFEAGGANCLIDSCTFRNNAGAAIEVLGLISPQARNVHIRRCRFDRNNYTYKNGPSEIQIWGKPDAPCEIACSNGLIEDNGCVLLPGIPFYVNESPSSNDWRLVGNRVFDFPDELNRAYPYPDPPEVSVCREIWTDSSQVALIGKADEAVGTFAWKQTEGPDQVRFECVGSSCTKAVFPTPGDYRVQLKADNGTLWRSARTAVHVLPKGNRTFKAWDFSRNLDAEGWICENSGTSYEFIPVKNSYWTSKSYPVFMSCGDYLVVTMKDAAEACIVTPENTRLGVTCNNERVNMMRVRMQNRTCSSQMRLWWQTEGFSPKWTKSSSVTFSVKPMDDGDSVYEVSLPPFGGIKRLKLSFSADETPITGTCRIDYIWLGRDCTTVKE